MAVKKKLAEIIHSPPCTEAGMVEGEDGGLVPNDLEMV
jgi:hypothetical protein